MKLLGFANLFVKKVSKDGKVYTFPELSVSSKDVKGKFVSATIKCNFAKDLVDVEGLEEDKCYNIEVKDSVLNVEYDDFKKIKVFKLYITDFDFIKTIDIAQPQNATTGSKKKLPK